MIENRQKTPSGPQGVLLGVPRDPQITQMAIQDAKMCLANLTNVGLWCQKGGKPESRRVKDWGPAAEGEALKINTIYAHFVFTITSGTHAQAHTRASSKHPSQCNYSEPRISPRV